MSREILFRGKRVEGGKWIYGYLSFFYIDNPGKGRIFSPKEVRSFDVISETVGQYTGLTDKNGTRIFEGDIVRYVEVDIDGTEDTYIGMICFNQPKAGYVIKRGDYIVNLITSLIESIEVIGNIFDNPELMEVTK